MPNTNALDADLVAIDGLAKQATEHWLAAVERERRVEEADARYAGTGGDLADRVRARRVPVPEPSADYSLEEGAQ